MNSKVNKNTIKIIIICIVIILAGCCLFLPSSVNLKFGYSSSRDISTAEANEIIYINLSTDDSEEHPILQHQPLSEGENNLELDTESVYAIGLAYNPSASGAGGYIMSLGNFHVSSNALDSVPISEDCEDEINLGLLTESDGNFKSTIESDKIAYNTGFSETALESYGEFDSSFRIIMNPDIDHDGVYDSDNSTFWRFTTLVDMNLNSSEINFDNADSPISIPIEDFGNFDLRYCIWLNGFGINTNDASRLKLKFTNPDTLSESLITSNHSPVEDGLQQIYFNILGNDMFVNADYILLLDDIERLYFNDITFLTPENNYEGFIFPIVKATADSSGNWKSISWRWLQIKDNQYTDVSDPDTIKLAIPIMYFYFWENGQSQAYSPEHFGEKYFENGSINVAGDGFDMGPSEDINYGYIATDFWDIGDNDYGFRYEIIIE